MSEGTGAAKIADWIVMKFDPGPVLGETFLGQAKRKIVAEIADGLREEWASGPDMLVDIWGRQMALVKEYSLDLKPLDAALREVVLAAEVELIELLQLTNWKPWKRTMKELDLRAIREEYADLLHFVVEIGILLGISAEDAWTAYREKNEENWRRSRDGY